MENPTISADVTVPDAENAPRKTRGTLSQTRKEGTQVMKPLRTAHEQIACDMATD